jgi:hypothetical protein
MLEQTFGSRSQRPQDSRLSDRLVEALVLQLRFWELLMLRSLRRHPFLTLALFGVILVIVFVALNFITPTYVGALFHR